MIKTNSLINPVSLFLVVITIILVVSCNSPKTKESTNQPNVILILTDDQGWGDLSLNGNPDLSTPNIDSLAQNGAMFDRFFVSPVCSPTRAEILTGRYHVRGGVYSTSAGGERLDLDETTIADIFKQNGYKTAAYGKWHNGMQYPYHPNARGFDDFYGFCSGHWGNYFSPVLEHNGKLVKGNGFLPDDLTNHAVNFIDTNKDNPFFLYLPFNTPHSPMQVPDKWWDKFKFKEPQNNHRYKEKENTEHTKAAYAMCENIDWNVGKIVNKIKELELEENTIIIYLSDNGPNGWRWNGGMEGVKGSTNEGGVRSPLIIQWSGKIEAGKIVKPIASAIDLLPTLTDLTGISSNSNKSIDGKSLKPLLLEKNANWEERFIVNHWRNKTSIRNQQFRIDDQNKLFDMISDPSQKEDIASKYPDILEEMVQYKKQWEKEVLIELPEKDIRTFPVGHPDFKYTQIPARDGTAHGNIKRSNRWPNSSFFTNWTSVQDSITWEIEVLEEGDYEAIVYYTCSEEDIGSTIELNFGTNSVKEKISVPHDPPLIGSEKDRVVRQESYVKDFIPLNMGILKLKKGTGTLALKSLNVKGNQVMDFRLIMLNRI
ncbi:MAG: arylsulfatase [Cyclobacteriaceae bacterium]|nr:arylsulfatase [Cyclobacteriaceae bacterium]